MDLVKREDYDALKEMTVRALDAVDALEARVAALEAERDARKSGGEGA